MKRLVLIVPDTIMHSVSNIKEIHRQELPVTVQHIIKALELDVYDENFFFLEGSVHVISVEDCYKRMPENLSYATGKN
jgi:hypothetical protein